jgi:uncharacterized protein (TIGR02117 family)
LKQKTNSLRLIKKNINMKKTLKIIGYTLLSFLLFVVFYAISAYGLSRISTAKEKSDGQDVAIYILTNGVHTDIVMPLKHEYIDWRKEFPFINTKGQDTSAQYLSMGWGDKGFYLNTPTWAELKFSTAFKAAFGLSTSAVHTTFYTQLNENNDCKRLLLSKTQYQRLINYIKNSLDFDTNNKPIFIKTDAVYGKDDAFYEAKGSYTMFHTCNTWANNALKSCGQKAALWTPFDTGIFYHYR